jgi:hypothetical protein
VVEPGGQEGGFDLFLGMAVEACGVSAQGRLSFC